MAYLTFLTEGAFAAIADLIHAGTACYVGWGNGVTEADPTDVDLDDPADEGRVVGTESQPSADVVQWVAKITSASNQDINEVGLFDAAGSGTPPTGGVLWLRKNHATVPVLIGDSIEYTIQSQATQ